MCPRCVLSPQDAGSGPSEYSLELWDATANSLAASATSAGAAGCATTPVVDFCESSGGPAAVQVRLACLNTDGRPCKVRVAAFMSPCPGGPPPAAVPSVDGGSGSSGGGTANEQPEATPQPAADVAAGDPAAEADGIWGAMKGSGSKGSSGISTTTWIIIGVAAGAALLAGEAGYNSWHRRVGVEGCLSSGIACNCRTSQAHARLPCCVLHHVRGCSSHLWRSAAHLAVGAPLPPPPPPGWRPRERRLEAAPMAAATAIAAVAILGQQWQRASAALAAAAGAQPNQAGRAASCWLPGRRRARCACCARSSRNRSGSTSCSSSSSSGSGSSPAPRAAFPPGLGLWLQGTCQEGCLHSRPQHPQRHAALARRGWLAGRGGDGGAALGGVLDV